jgi:hypothetical protein
MKDSVQNRTMVIFPTNFNDFSGGSGPDLYFQYYSIAGTWPTTVGDATYDSTNKIMNPPTSIAINLAPMFDSPLFAITSLLDMDPATAEPRFYQFTLDVQQTPSFQFTGATIASASPITVLSLTDATSQSVGLRSSATTTMTGYALKLNDITLNGTLGVSDALLESLKQFLGSQTGSPFSYNAFNQIVVRPTPGGPISVYIPLFPAYIACNSFNLAGQSMSLDLMGTPADTSDDTAYTTKGSFWWAIADFVTFMNGPQTPAAPQ